MHVGVIASRVADEQTFRHLRLVRTLRIRYKSLWGSKIGFLGLACGVLSLGLIMLRFDTRW